jgi:hypothetical protein
MIRPAMGPAIFWPPVIRFATLVKGATTATNL